MRDVSWYIQLEITLDSEEARWEDLDEATQEHILNEVKEGNFSGLLSEEGGEDNE